MSCGLLFSIQISIHFDCKSSTETKTANALLSKGASRRKAGSTSVSPFCSSPGSKYESRGRKSINEIGSFDKCSAVDDNLEVDVIDDFVHVGKSLQIVASRRLKGILSDDDGIEDDDGEIGAENEFCLDENI